MRKFKHLPGNIPPPPTRAGESPGEGGRPRWSPVPARERGAAWAQPQAPSSPPGRAPLRPRRLSAPILAGRLHESRGVPGAIVTMETVTSQRHSDTGGLGRGGEGPVARRRRERNQPLAGIPRRRFRCPREPGHAVLSCPVLPVLSPRRHPWALAAFVIRLGAEPLFGTQRRIPARTHPPQGTGRPGSWVRMLPLPHAGRVSQGKSLVLCGPQWPHLLKEQAGG
ncbi:uncharacterized protein LOC110197056 [Phascolarctos cinereus]|uniref:Uncharacterized protein LOC110197056 n=1 Tax=Phascolarctos cinereus TaxID=38626 RepID=A0A6P5IVY8_PHACI|nr:uncharacterized protein LOC110197056 [Phascolarctos cinereus]XP_020826302.1 uncharacterized protein LOC110197056 [Phascolarctos cinereus]